MKIFALLLFFSNACIFANSPVSESKDLLASSLVKIEKVDLENFKGQQDGPEELSDIILGKDDASVILIEYSSSNCAACADFHRERWSFIKDNFINNGKIRFIYRHFPLDYHAALSMSIIAQQPKEKWIHLLEKVYLNYEEWAKDHGSLESLCKILKLKEEFAKNVLQQKALISKIMAKRYNIEKVLDIKGTPQFIIIYRDKNGKKKQIILPEIDPCELDNLLEHAVTDSRKLEQTIVRIKLRDIQMQKKYETQYSKTVKTTG